MTTDTFSSQVRYEHGRGVIDLRGEIDAQADDLLNQAYADADRNGPEVIVLNFTDVEYINSTGIALIVGLLAQARKAQRRVVVFGLSDHYTQIFQITRLADFMDIFEDEKSALTM